MCKGTSLLLSELSGILARDPPAGVLTVADRHETIATAIAASYQNIPLFHIQGGESTGSIDDRVRRAITQLSDHHLVATDKAASEILRLCPGARFEVVGCPSIDIAENAEMVDRVTEGAGAEVDLSGPFLVVIQHPVTTEYAHAAWQIDQTIRAIRSVGFPAIWFWPALEAGHEISGKELRMKVSRDPSVRLVRQMRPERFYGLCRRSACVVGNSSFGIREASFLGVPAVNIGSRQQHRERAQNVVDVGHDSKAIADAIAVWSKKTVPRSTLYGTGRAGELICEYVDRELGL
jgi:UDP-hydrolysing UDP-N-acetyl-D-glucosamine 2-epimerase